jgi:hypothetical protein
MKRVIGVLLCLVCISSEAAPLSVRLDQVQGGDDHGETPSVIGGTVTGFYNTISGVVTMDPGTTSITFLSLSQSGNTLFVDSNTNWSTGAGAYSAGGYTCVEGTFVAPASFCGDYYFGFNGIDESSLDYSGIPGTRSIGGDDGISGAMRQGALYTTSVEFFDGDLLILRSALWNELGLGGTSTDGLELTYSVVPLPSAVWLFGCALGLLGWMKRKAG